MQLMLPTLKKYFGYESFRPLQEDVIRHSLSGGDALALMPTGGGKSLCFQLPALLLPGLTVVVSPLIALMKDQVDSLKSNGIAAEFINSSLSPAEIAAIESKAENGRLKLLYLAPERLAAQRVLFFLQSLKISLFAIDEAHCISEWGHDFRPDYRNLKVLRRLFSDVPIIALTATANVQVRQDIVAALGLRRGRIFQSSFDRPNLTYRVIPKKNSFEQLLWEIRKLKGGSAIIYCFSRKGTEKVAVDLEVNGIKALAYHAGLSHKDRTRTQEKFIRDQVPVVAATIAFGMGIDKPDIRLVAHLDLPKSVEGYYQETGRAGRDGLPSDCILFYSRGDVNKHEFFIREMEDPAEQARARRQLRNMVAYAELGTCRRNFLLNYFGEAGRPTNCGGCDICSPRETQQLAPEAVADYDRELFETLRVVRRALAEANGVPPYVIFGDKTLQEMARYFPQSPAALAQIFGVGREKLARYGERMLKEIRQYAQSKGIAERANDRIEKPRVTARRALPETVLLSAKLFIEKRTPAQIAAVRGLSQGTILDHLEKALADGIRLDASHLTFPDEARFQNIVRAFQKTGGNLLAPVRNLLGEAYTYDEIRYARFLMQTR